MIDDLKLYHDKNNQIQALEKQVAELTEKLRKATNLSVRWKCKYWKIIPKTEKPLTKTEKAIYLIKSNSGLTLNIISKRTKLSRKYVNKLSSEVKRGLRG